MHCWWDWISVCFFTLLGRSPAVIPHQSTTVLDRPAWSFLSHSAAREQAKGTSAGDAQGDGLGAAVVLCLLMLWLHFSFWPEAGKFGACLRAERFLQTAGYAQPGKVEVKPSVLKRMINKGQGELKVSPGTLLSVVYAMSGLFQRLGLVMPSGTCLACNVPLVPGWRDWQGCCSSGC